MRHTQTGAESLTVFATQAFDLFRRAWREGQTPYEIWFSEKKKETGRKMRFIFTQPQALFGFHRKATSKRRITD